jgi:hypothetical protein
MWHIGTENTKFENSFLKSKKSNLWLITHRYKILNITLDHMWHISTEDTEFGDSLENKKNHTCG